LRQLSRQEGATLYMTLLAAFSVFLARYSGQDDIVVGAPIANRSQPELEGLIGFFANTLVLRADLSGDPCFTALLARVLHMAVQAYEHQEMPFEGLVEALQPERSRNRNPLFQVALIQHNPPIAAASHAGLTFAEADLASGAAVVDLTVTFR